MKEMGTADPRPAGERGFAEKTRLTDAPTVDARTPGPEVPQTSVDILRKKVLEANPDIAEYRRLRKTVLPTSEQRRIFRDMLMDPEQLAAAMSDLLVDDVAFSEELQFQRMYRISFLDAALEWKENPAREDVVSSMQDVIFASNIRADAPSELQHSLAGDKVELYLSLLEHAPEQAAQIAAKAKGTDLEKLLAYAQARYDAVATAEAGED